MISLPVRSTRIWQRAQHCHQRGDGTRLRGGTNTASGGLHIVDMPTLGLPPGRSQDGYTHDHRSSRTSVQTGTKKEIAFVQRARSPWMDDHRRHPHLHRRLQRLGHTHQGWLTRTTSTSWWATSWTTTKRRQHAHLLSTWRTRQPLPCRTYTATTSAIDHNLYIKDGVAYQSNYRAGLRLLDVSNTPNAEEIGLSYPKRCAQFNGTGPTTPTSLHCGSQPHRGD